MNLRLSENIGITEVASLVGHKGIQTTYNNYMHLADKTLQRTAMRYPMVRKNVDLREIIKAVKKMLEVLHLENDLRFKFYISNNDDCLNFALKIRPIDLATKRR